MDNQQLLMFKGWFIDSYPECKDYLDLTYFDVEKNTFLSKCSYNPDSGNAAKVLKIAFGSWQHQQAKVEELQLKISEDSRILHNVIDLESKKNGELQKRVDALELKLREIAGIARRARHGEYYTESGRNAGLNIAAEIEQALKGDQYDEHRKKAEEAISKGASLTNHRIEL
ncbi:hypothetical protein RFX69_17790 [Acinetobacter sp. 148]|nr:hypothetical protein [Acinetobacter sp. 148]MDQ9908852.1 hypothetical protein [Acinetobacter sp. 148]